MRAMTGRIGPNNSGIARGGLDRRARTLAIHPLFENSFGTMTDRPGARRAGPKLRQRRERHRPRSAVSLRPAEDITARRRFFSMNSRIHQDDEENPASGFLSQLHPNRL